MTRVVALALTVLTGFSGLVYEVVWEKYLATLLGSHSEATVAVLGLFLGGLALGYAFFGKLAARLIERAERSGKPPRLLVVYGAFEAGIGFYALAFPILFAAVRSLSTALPHGSELASFLVDVLLAGVLILPPALLMGGTIPMLTQALARGIDDSTRVHALVYGFNTAGAFSGALAAGFFLIPALGLVWVMVCMGTINLFAGALFGALGIRRGDEIASAVQRAARLPAAAEAVPGLRGYFAVALLAGFAMMTIQVVLIRIGALSFGASQFTFSMVVAVFVLCIALGSFAVSAFKRVPTPAIVFNQWALILLLYFLDHLLEFAPYGAHVLRSRFPSHDAAFYPFHLSAFASVLVVIGVPVTLSGATLPLLFHLLRRQVVDLGATAGRIYGWNTLGSFLGALLGGYTLLFWLDLDEVYRLAVTALAVAGTILVVRIYRISWLAAALVLLVPAGGALALRPPWNPVYLMSGLFRERQPLRYTYAGPDTFYRTLEAPTYIFHEDDPIATIGVAESRRGGRVIERSIVTNGKSDSSTAGDYPTTGLLATLPALLADRMERAFVIGYGTGVTAGELASIAGAREVVVAEISPAIVAAAPYFDFANMNTSRNPRVRIVRRDAYRALLDDRGTFDVIVSEPSNPWVAGVEMLFSREFLTAARDRLRPGGVHCQWFHLYETDVETVSLVLRTYAAVFDDVAIWYGRGVDLLLLGFEGGPREIDLERLRKRSRRPDFSASLRRARVDSFPALLAHELVPVGVVREMALAGPIHSLYRPRLAYAAARAFFRGSNARLPFSGVGAAAQAGRENSLWRRHLRSLDDRAKEEDYERFTKALCAKRNPECVAALADWRRAFPGSARLERVYGELQQSRFTFGGKLQRRTLRRYFDTFLASDAGEISLEAARSADQLLRRHYFHAAPPPPDALVDLWRRCREQADEPDGCAEGLRVAEAISRAAGVRTGVAGSGEGRGLAPPRR